MTNRSIRKQGGFTIIELTLVIAIMGIMFVMLIPVLGRLQDARLVELTRNTIAQLMQASIARYTDEDRINRFRQWATNPNVLVTQGYYYTGPGATTVPDNPYGFPYTFTIQGGACPAPPDPCPNDAVLVISTTIDNAADASAIVQPWAGFSDIDDTTLTAVVISVGVPMPSQEGSHWMLLARDGTREMLGNLRMDDHSIDLTETAGNPAFLAWNELRVQTSATQFSRVQGTGRGVFRTAANDATIVLGPRISAARGGDGTLINAGTLTADTELNSPRFESTTGAGTTTIVGDVVTIGPAGNRTQIDDDTITSEEGNINVVNAQTVDADQLSATTLVYR